LHDHAPGAASRLLVHFVGTGSSPDDPMGHRVLPRARAAGVERMISEHPHRIGYVDTLNHLMHASGVLVLGSTEPHYTPSKVFQAMLSERRVFAMLHRDSTAVGMIRSARAGDVLTLVDGDLPPPATVSTALLAFVQRPSGDRGPADRSLFETFSARESTRQFAEALDRAMARSGRA
jgi:hypothetical protein